MRNLIMEQNLLYLMSNSKLNSMRIQNKLIFLFLYIRRKNYT